MLMNFVNPEQWESRFGKHGYRFIMGTSNVVIDVWVFCQILVKIKRKRKLL